MNLQLSRTQPTAVCKALSCPRSPTKRSSLYYDSRCLMDCSSTTLPDTWSTTEHKPRYFPNSIEKTQRRSIRSVPTWHNMNAWNNEDMCKTDALDCSGNPENMTCTWFATWQEASSGIGCADGLGGPWVCVLLLPEYIAVCVREPNKIQDNNLMCPMQSAYCKNGCRTLKKMALTLAFLMFVLVLNLPLLCHRRRASEPRKVFNYSFVVPVIDSSNF